MAGDKEKALPRLKGFHEPEQRDSRGGGVGRGEESKLCIGGFQFVTIFQTCSDTSDMCWIKMSKKNNQV